MKLYLISNNSLLDGLSYDNKDDLENIRKIRTLSVNGEENAKRISENSLFENIEKIYSSYYSSSLSSAKYLADKLNLNINLNELFNDCKVGYLGSKNMKMVKGLQDHDFNYKLTNGESLNEVGNRLENGINKIINNEDIVIFTHKRAILGYLLKFSSVGYNLDDSLILEFNGKQIYDDSDTEFDIYELIIENNRLVDINLK